MASDLPIACTLTPEALQARREGLLSDLVRRAGKREMTTTGLRLQFAADSEVLSLIARAVEAERQCCRFLRFEITVEPDGGPVILQLSGPSGTPEFVETLFVKGPEPDRVIQAADHDDLPSVRRLLETQHLPLDGIDEHVSTMVVAKKGNDVVGAAAVELYEDGALLRSVVVDPTVQGQGLGHRLSEAALSLARDRGKRTAFLLTTTAEKFFPKLGFEPIVRDDVPASVQASIEFQSACPASAVVMRRRLA